MTSEKYNNEKTFYPNWFKYMQLVETHDEYKVYNYINLEIQTTPDSKFFNASRLIRLLSSKVRDDGTKSSSKSMTVLMRSKKWSGLKKSHPDLFIEVKGKDTQHYKGIYLQWILFSTFIGYASNGADINFELGEEIVEDTKGFIYMCCPESCDGTDTIKFGRTWNWNQRIVGYGLDTYLFHLIPVDDMYLAEEKMLKFMDSFLTGDKEKGDEYYIINNDKEALKAENYFEELCNEFNVKDLAY